MDFSQLVGKTLKSIQNTKADVEFQTTDGEIYRLYHPSDCCETVEIEDICGDLKDLIGNPLLMAEKSTSHENPKGVTKTNQDSFTWTFYKLATIRGHVTIRWYGESNGYYSESVEFLKEDSIYFGGRAEIFKPSSPGDLHD
jgi:hypothetical protein